MGHYYPEIIKFAVGAICASAIAITIIVMPANRDNIFPEAVDKARELCIPHDGIINLDISAYGYLNGERYNHITVICKNKVELKAIVKRGRDEQTNPF
jgi:hypothetical protein